MGEHFGGYHSAYEYTGAFNPVSSIMAGDQLRIFNLYYQQAWSGDAIRLKLGQLAVDDEFMKSDFSSLFLNSAFGAMPSQVGTPLATSCGNSPPFPIYSVAAPGIFLRGRPAESIYTQLGLYYGRPGLDTPDNHGFAWIDETPPELGLFWENGYCYKLAQCPATIRLGLTYHTGQLDDFGRATAGAPPATRQAVPNYYAIQDLQILADPDGKPKLGLFCRGGITPEPDLSMVSLYADAGFNWFAPLQFRPDDIAGVAISYPHGIFAEVSSNQVSSTQATPQRRLLTEAEANEVRVHNLDPTGMTIRAGLPVLRAPTQEELESLKQQGVDVPKLPPKLLFDSPDAGPALHELIEKAEKADTKDISPDLRNATIYMDNFLGTDAVVKGHIISMKAELIKFRLLGKNYENCGHFMVILNKPREHKKPRFGLGSPETAKLVMCDGVGGQLFPLPNATIWEKSAGFIDVVALEKEWIYSGHYTIQNTE